MSLRTIVFLICLWLLPAIAAAQIPQSMSPNTVIGRGAFPSNGGPPQSIPFAKLFANAGIAAGPQSCSSHNWFNTLNAGGVLGCSQPSFADISGTIAGSQLPPAGASSLGGVNSHDCSPGSQFLQKINTDGSITCATPSGAGTVTEQKNTASVGLTTSGNCDNTSSNSGSPCNYALALTNTSVNNQPTNSTTVGSSAGLMSGYGKDQAGSGAHPCALTPTYSGRIRFEIIGSFANATGGDSVGVQLLYGTGTAPSSGGTVTGTVLSNFVSAAGGGSTNIGQIPFAVSGIATGLTPGTAYWFDLALKVNASTGSTNNVTCNAFEF